MGDIIALFPQKERGHLENIQLLALSEYRTHGIGAIENAKKFRKVFEGGLLYRLRLRQRKRRKEDFVILLVKSGICKNTQEAEEYIRQILGQTLLYKKRDRDNEFFTVINENGQYSLKYTRCRLPF